MDVTWFAPGSEFVLRYLYADGSLQARFPTRVVSDDAERTVLWLAPGTPIMYWATADGGDPRATPLETRFRQRLTTAQRHWQGGGVLQVLPAGQPYQVVHFWGPDGTFATWYVNFEAPRRRTPTGMDTSDWQLDLVIGPDLTATWKDEDEAEAAIRADHLRRSDYEAARAAGDRIMDQLSSWPAPIGDWRGFDPATAPA